MYLMWRLSEALTDDLGKSLSCVATEALYYLGLKNQGYYPHRIRHEGVGHWFLKADRYIETTMNRMARVDLGEADAVCNSPGGKLFEGEYERMQMDMRWFVVDAMVSQFKTVPPYHKGKKCSGYYAALKWKPSRRAQIVIDRVLKGDAGYKDGTKHIDENTGEVTFT